MGGNNKIFYHFGTDNSWKNLEVHVTLGVMKKKPALDL